VRTFCLFTGYPRSGHSLVGALLDAHPNAVIAHEQQALRYLRAGIGREPLLYLLEQNAMQPADSARSRFAVDGQWQGRHSQMRVMGDKAAWGTSLALERRPQLAETAQRVMRGSLRWIHVVRNPFDIIARIAEREAIALDGAAAHFARLARVNSDLRDRTDACWDVRLERLIGAPGSELAKLCGYLGLDVTAKYLEACSKIVFDSPRRARESARWSPELIGAVQAEIGRHSFLAGYGFDTE
jgi:hypothetical protein